MRANTTTLISTNTRISTNGVIRTNANTTAALIGPNAVTIFI